MLVFIPIILVLIIAILLVSKDKPTASNTMGVETTSVPQTVEETAGTLAEDVQPFMIEGGSFYFKPNEIRVKVGQKVKVTLSPVGEMTHDFIIDEFNVRTKQIEAGETDIVEFTPDKVGTYEFYCSVGKHRSMGMVGKLIVE